MKLEGSKVSGRGKSFVNVLFKALIKIFSLIFKNQAQLILTTAHFFLTCCEYDLNTVACTCKNESRQTVASLVVFLDHVNFGFG